MPFDYWQHDGYRSLVRLQYKGLEIGEGSPRFVFDLSGILPASHRRIQLRLKVVAEIERGTIQLRSVEIVSPGEITSAVLRAVPLRRMQERIVEELRRNPTLQDGQATLRELIRAAGESGWPPDLLARLDQAEEEAHRRARFLAPPKRGRRARSPDFYREIALDYLHTLRREPRKVVEAMAASRGVPRPTVSTWIRRAREEGWLTKSTQGKAGGEPGPKLRAWVKEQE
jgi:hypothetical protein